MKRVDFMRALRDYEEAKAALEKAEKRMETARTPLYKQYDGTGFVFIPLWQSSEEFIISAISQLKKAYYAYHGLFKDHEFEERTLLRQAIEDQPPW